MENQIIEVFSLISAREGRTKSEKEGTTKFFFPQGYDGPRTPDDPLPSSNLGKGYYTYEEFLAMKKEEEAAKKKPSLFWRLFHRGAH